MTAEIKALKRNSLSLLAEYEKMEAKHDALAARIAILESEVKAEKEHSKALSRKNETLQAQVTDLTSKNKTLQDSNILLLQSKELLVEIQAVYTKLASCPRPTSPPLPDIYIDPQDIAECEAINQSIYGKTAGDNLPVPMHLQPLTDTIKKTLK